MEDHCKRRGDAERDADKVAACDDDAVDEVVDAVAEQVHPYVGLHEAVVMAPFFRVRKEVAVMPAEELLDHEEYHEAEEGADAKCERCCAALDGLGKEVDEGVAEKRADRKADEEEQHLLKERPAQRQENNADERQKAHEREACERVEPGFRHHEAMNGSGVYKFY